jgi:hypothetical protein
LIQRAFETGIEVLRRPDASPQGCWASRSPQRRPSKPSREFEYPGIPGRLTHACPGPPLFLSGGCPVGWQHPAGFFPNPCRPVCSRHGPRRDLLPGRGFFNTRAVFKHHLHCTGLFPAVVISGGERRPAVRVCAFENNGGQAGAGSSSTSPPVTPEVHHVRSRHFGDLARAVRRHGGRSPTPEPFQDVLENRYGKAMCRPLCFRCGERLVCQRSTRRYCSNACRRSVYGRRRSPRVRPPPHPAQGGPPICDSDAAWRVTMYEPMPAVTGPCFVLFIGEALAAAVVYGPEYGHNLRPGRVTLHCCEAPVRHGRQGTAAVSSFAHRCVCCRRSSHGCRL